MVNILLATLEATKCTTNTVLLISRNLIFCGQIQFCFFATTFLLNIHAIPRSTAGLFACCLAANNTVLAIYNKEINYGTSFQLQRQLFKLTRLNKTQVEYSKLIWNKFYSKSR